MTLIPSHSCKQWVRVCEPVCIQILKNEREYIGFSLQENTLLEILSNAYMYLLSNFLSIFTHNNLIHSSICYKYALDCVCGNELPLKCWCHLIHISLMQKTPATVLDSLWKWTIQFFIKIHSHMPLFFTNVAEQFLSCEQQTSGGY